ncbi:HU family DNA-binding protein [Novosphingobium pokkalii]|uniref:HU family DNA-binding protein n=1 Tax=Novosphingobium pokkalii TaxID=1770194 RepID=A0ABV7V251_9SPHN
MENAPANGRKPTVLRLAADLQRANQALGPRPAFWRNATMNTTELVDAVAASQGIAKAEVRKTVDAVFAAIAEAAAKGEEISLNAFGKFKVKDVPAREGRNPSTGEPIQIAASRKLSFAPAKALKDKLNG